MNTRIKLKTKNVVDLLKILEKNDESMCTLELDLELSKSIIKILDNYSEDWDFVDSHTPNLTVPKLSDAEYIEDCTVTLPKVEDSKSDVETEPLNYYKSSLGVKDYNTLATLVESIFRLYKQSPNIKFESGLFFNTLEIEYQNLGSEPISIEHSLIAMIIEAYYGKTSMDEALEDTVGKLRGLWISKELGEHPNTTSLTKILYGGKK